MQSTVFARGVWDLRIVWVELRRQSQVVGAGVRVAEGKTNELDATDERKM